MPLDPTAVAQPGDPVNETPPVGPDLAVDEADNTQRRAAEAVTTAFFKEFNDARTFDKNIRLQIYKDRLYASGQAQMYWAVSTNLIGSIIDILVAVLYARDPDVSARKTPQTENSPDPATGLPPDSQIQRDAEMTARTLELVVSKLWKKAKMKARMRRIVRGVLSTGQGWLKILPETVSQPDPIAQSEFNTLKDNLARFEAIRNALSQGQTLEGVTASDDQLLVLQQQLESQLEALSQRLEVQVCQGITIDVVRPEDMQISTDVELLADHLDADWNAQLIYVPIEKLSAMFPSLTKDDLATVEKFYKQPPKNANAGEVDGTDFGVAESMVDAMLNPTTNADGECYTSSKPTEGSQAFACVVEKWDRTDNHVHTYIKGVKVPAQPRYQPSWATSRFYPFFYFSVYEVDGSRAPQSLAARLAKLQDEYSTTRSNFRISRERSIPSTIVDATKMADTELAKVQRSVREEFVPAKFTDSTTDMTKVFMEKPVGKIDPRLYDTQPIIQDMERIAGVQEAQQSTVSVEKTATEAEIQQAGFSARTTAARDMIEVVLTDIAHYTAELALQTLDAGYVQRIAGPFAFWPEGMSRDDIVTLVEMEIVAGTTGKPRNRGDREAWAVVMPLIKEVQGQIAMLQLDPMQMPLANALKELLKETMLRMGDDSDVTRFLPAMPILPPGAAALLGPAAGAAPQPGGPLPPGASPEGGAAPAPVSEPAEPQLEV